MRINRIGGKDVDVTLSADELVYLSNILYFYERHHKEVRDECQASPNRLKPLHHEIAAQIITARDLCQYGHLDTFSLKCLVKHKVAANPDSRLAKYVATGGEGEDYGQAGKDREIGTDIGGLQEGDQ